MNRNLILSSLAILVFVLATGCTRNRRQENVPPTDTQAPAPAAAATDVLVQATAAPSQTLAPTLTLPATSTAIPSLTPISATAAASQGQSDPLADQLDQALKDFDQSLNSIDTLDDPP